MPLRNARFAIAVLLLLALVFAGTVTIPPEVLGAGVAKALIVNEIDTSRFPVTTVYISVLDEDGAHILGLDKTSFEVMEDGAARVLESVRSEASGILLAVLVDLSGSMSARGMTGRPRIDEARDLVTGELCKLFAKGDGVTVIGFHTALTPTMALTTDYVAACNLVYSSFVLPPAAQNTRLFDAAYQAVESLSSLPDQGRKRKAVIILSDGEDTQSDLKRAESAVARAQQYGIPIFTIGLGDEADPVDPLKPKDLGMLAILSRGQYIHYSSPQARSQIVTFLQRLVSQRDQYVLTYRSKVRAAGKHEVLVRASRTTSLVEGRREFLVGDIPPPKVELMQPANGLVLQRQANGQGQLQMQARITFPAIPDRTLQKIDYYVDQVKAFSGSGTDLSYRLDASSLAKGSHTLWIQVTDELGLESRSEAVNVVIADPEPTFLQKLLLRLTTDPAFVMAILATLLAGAVALWLFLMRGNFGGVVEFIDEITEPITAPIRRFMKGGKSQTVPRQDRPYLLVDDGTRRVIRKAITRIGRRRGTNDIVFEDDRTVSRDQAEIKERGSEFIITNLSVNAPTHVNDELVPPAGKPLQDGDVITMGYTRATFKRPDTSREDPDLTNPMPKKARDQEK